MRHNKSSTSRINHYVISLAVLWSLLSLFFLIWNWDSGNDAIHEAAIEEARTHFERDQALRLWATSHGGVYVLVDEHTPPNPYLHVPDKNVETTSGLSLTLINPAYMIRQINENYTELYGVVGHITSLNPLRPANKPDEWERNALLQFEAGAAEVLEFIETEDKYYLRLMHPMFVEEGCLKCHAIQGYEVGDLRGGVSIQLLMEPFIARRNAAFLHSFEMWLVLWIGGLVGIGLISYGLHQRLSEQDVNTDALRRSEARYRQVFETNKAVKFIFDPKTKMIVDVNEAACAYYGYSYDALTSMYVSEINMLPSDAIESRLALVFNEEQLYFEFKHRLASGEIRDVEVYAGPIVGDDDNLLLYAIVHDITQRKEAEATLHQLVEELEKRVGERTEALQLAMEKSEQANLAKGVFLANMSHELRTPLNAILAYAQLMQRDEVVFERQPESVLAIKQSGEHLLALINEVLELSRIEQLGISLSESMYDVYEEYETLRRMFSARLHEKSLTLAVEIEPDVPPQLRVDGRKLRQILINLIGNAIKFTHEGGIVLRMSVKDFAIDRPFQLHIEVEDSGVGIPAEEMDGLFMPFVQTSSGQNLQSGTGLGLSICYHYVDLMGGELTAVSTPNISTIFKFDVLVTAVDTPSPPPAVAEYKIIGLAANQPEIRLLIAEDNDASRAALIDLLEDIGFAIHGVANGEEAVAEWARWRPHLIWMDTRMPIMMGREAVKKIRSQAGGENVVIIALTADALLDIEGLKTDGYDDYLFKPFQLDDLLQKIGQYLPVTYTYATAIMPTTAPEREITAVDLQKMAAEWISALHNAAMQGRAEHVLSLIDEIDETDIEMKQQLSCLVETFQFDAIVALTTA